MSPALYTRVHGLQAKDVSVRQFPYGERINYVVSLGPVEFYSREDPTKLLNAFRVAFMELEELIEGGVLAALEYEAKD